MNKIVVDASVFLSSALEREVHSKASRQFFEEIKGSGTRVVVPILTLFEVLHNFYRASKNSVATERIHDYFVNLNVTGALKILNLEASFLAHFFSSHKDFDLKTSDVIVTLTALREKCPLISWDKQMLKMASKKVEALTPAEYLKKH